MHPELFKLFKLFNMPDSFGKRVSMKHYEWHKLTPYEEVAYAGKTVELANLVDNELAKFERVGGGND